jgi:HEAT repeat protein
MNFRFAVFLACAFVLYLGTADAAAPEPDIAAAEKVLTDAGITIDGPGLLAYLRKETRTPEQEEEFKAAVRRLGHDDFEVRERASRHLTEAGRLAVPFLKAALNDPDLEIARRAKRALEDMKVPPATTLMTAVCRLLVVRRPPDATATLLAYLPNADDEVIEEAVFQALGELGIQAGKPDAALLKALDDTNSLRRAAAASVIGRCPWKEDRRAALKLLNDAEPRVRYEAAYALLRSGEKPALPPLIALSFCSSILRMASADEKPALPPLIALLTDGPMPLAWQTEDILCRLAGDQLPAATLGTGKADERRKCREVWEAWWKTNEATIDLAKFKSEEPLRGLTVVTEYDGNEGGRVWEFGPEGKIRWQIKNLNGPNDVQLLSGGRVLIAERNGNRVTERDREGKILWEYHSTNNSPISAQRLPNGNTLVATFAQLLEVSPDKQIVQSYTHPSGFRHAVRLRTGNTLFIASNGQVVELDAQFKQVRAIMPEANASGAGYWASIEPLANGRLLVALGSSNKVVEIDGNGKIVWQCDSPYVVFASRLANGNTLTSSFENRCLIEYDRNGKEVHRTTLMGRPFVFRRY